MIEAPIPKGRKKCDAAGCICGWIPGNSKSPNPMDHLPSPCPKCKGKGYK